MNNTCITKCCCNKAKTSTQGYLAGMRPYLLVHQDVHPRNEKRAQQQKQQLDHNKSKIFRRAQQADKRIKHAI